jgi:hypothetical protein
MTIPKVQCPLIKRVMLPIYLILAEFHSPDQQRSVPVRIANKRNAG